MRGRDGGGRGRVWLRGVRGNDGGWGGGGWFSLVYPGSEDRVDLWRFMGERACLLGMMGSCIVSIVRRKCSVHIPPPGHP